MRLPIVKNKCLFRRRGLQSSNNTVDSAEMRFKINTVYRRMQNAFKQYVELHNCGMVQNIPNLDLEVFDEINDYLGLSNNDTALRQLQFDENGLVDSTPENFIEHEINWVRNFNRKLAS